MPEKVQIFFKDGEPHYRVTLADGSTDEWDQKKAHDQGIIDATGNLIPLFLPGGASSGEDGDLLRGFLDLLSQGFGTPPREDTSLERSGSTVRAKALDEYGDTPFGRKVAARSQANIAPDFRNLLRDDEEALYQQWLAGDTFDERVLQAAREITEAAADETADKFEEEFRLIFMNPFAQLRVGVDKGSLDDIRLDMASGIVESRIPTQVAGFEAWLISTLGPTAEGQDILAGPLDTATVYRLMGRYFREEAPIIIGDTVVEMPAGTDLGAYGRAVRTEAFTAAGRLKAEGGQRSLVDKAVDALAVRVGDLVDKEGLSPTVANDLMLAMDGINILTDAWARGFALAPPEGVSARAYVADLSSDSINAVLEDAGFEVVAGDAFRSITATNAAIEERKEALKQQADLQEDIDSITSQYQSRMGTDRGFGLGAAIQNRVDGQTKAQAISNSQTSFQEAKVAGDDLLKQQQGIDFIRGRATELGFNADAAVERYLEGNRTPRQAVDEQIASEKPSAIALAETEREEEIENARTAAAAAGFDPDKVAALMQANPRMTGEQATQVLRRIQQGIAEQDAIAQETRLTDDLNEGLEGIVNLAHEERLEGAAKEHARVFSGEALPQFGVASLEGLPAESQAFARGEVSLSDPKALPAAQAGIAGYLGASSRAARVQREFGLSPDAFVKLLAEGGTNPVTGEQMPGSPNAQALQRNAISLLQQAEDAALETEREDVAIADALRNADLSQTDFLDPDQALVAARRHAFAQDPSSFGGVFDPEAELVAQRRRQGSGFQLSDEEIDAQTEARLRREDEAGIPGFEGVSSAELRGVSHTIFSPTGEATPGPTAMSQASAFGSARQNRREKERRALEELGQRGQQPPKPPAKPSRERRRTPARRI